MVYDAPATLCYKCGEKGHFARGCTKIVKVSMKKNLIPKSSFRMLVYKFSDNPCIIVVILQFDHWDGASSTPRRVAKENVDSFRFRSVPRDFGKEHKKKKKKMLELEDKYDDRWNMTSGKSRIKGGWIVDDPGDLSGRKQKANRLKSRSTSLRKGHDVSSSPSRGHYSTPQSSSKKHRSFLGTPNFNASTNDYHHGYSTPRYYAKSHDSTHGYSTPRYYAKSQDSSHGYSTPRYSAKSQDSTRGYSTPRYYAKSQDYHGRM